MGPPRQFACCALLVFLGVAFASYAALAQTPPENPAPYASLDRNAVSYQGPGRASSNDLTGDAVTIGLLLPLQGKRAPEAKLLLAAALLALEDEQAAGNLPDGRRLALAVREESERWGQASSNIMQLIEQDQAVALITSFSGDIAHQAEQVANKLSVPVVTLSSDPTTTEINIPWIFRLGPSDTDQAHAIAAAISANPALEKILLIADADRDGRIGSAEFQKAFTALHAQVPHLDVIQVDPSTSDDRSLLDQLQLRNPDALVLWTGPQTTAFVLSLAVNTNLHAPVFLSRKSAQFVVVGGSEKESAIRPASASDTRVANTFVVALATNAGTSRDPDFSQKYVRRTGAHPGLAATELYDAVRLLAAAIRHAGPNRARVRDVLASGAIFTGLTGKIAFDPAGNSSSADLLLAPGGKLVAPVPSEAATRASLPHSALD